MVAIYSQRSSDGPNISYHRSLRDAIHNALKAFISDQGLKGEEALRLWNHLVTEIEIQVNAGHLPIYFDPNDDYSGYKIEEITFD